MPRPTLNVVSPLLLVVFIPKNRFSVTALPYGINVDAECMIQFIKRTGAICGQIQFNWRMFIGKWTMADLILLA